jgi:phage shock protein E
MKKLLTALATVVAVSISLAGCSSSPGNEIVVTSDTTIVDVRTADEFALGHLEGALNIDVNSPDFDAQIAQLPTDGTYVVYCKSGNRAGAAIARMTELGFTNLTNAGGLAAASASTGLAIVTGP